ncbi:MAG: hemerythrin domain-containing protein [Planctomycetales bacterium]|nr:hemerythrin domain-containing protein [Planctomycetales bacterium]
MAHDATTRQYADAVHADHRQLAGLLSDIRAEFDAEERSKRRLEKIVTTLSELCEAHFRREEEGGYMREAVQQAPQLSARARTLGEEHEELQEQIEKLRILIHSGVESSAWWIRVQSDFAAFAKQISRHESEENALLQEAFSQDIGTKD